MSADNEEIIVRDATDDEADYNEIVMIEREQKREAIQSLTEEDEISIDELSGQTDAFDYEEDDDFSLESLFADGKYPFTNILGEAPEIADFILQNKQAFLADLNYVLQNNTEDLFILADKAHFLDRDFKPSDVLPLEKNDSYVFYRNDLSLRTPAEKSLRIMGEGAKKDGVTLVVSSTFRSYDYQKMIYERNVKQMGQAAADRESARPGTSQHQLGTAVDFGSITDDFAETKAGKWLEANAMKYGWSLSFPQGYESVTGYRWECWHYRYIGIPACAFQQKWFKNVQQYMMEFIYNWQ